MSARGAASTENPEGADKKRRPVRGGVQKMWSPLGAMGYLYSVSTSATVLETRDTIL